MIKIAIIGMGMIGTSLGMALRTADERSAPLGKISVAGYDVDRRATAEARGRLAIDREAATLGDAVRDAHLIIIAVPVQSVPETLRAIATLATPGAVVTDVSSTKAQVLAWASDTLPATIDFIGGHPMAGKERTGPAAADAELFRNAIYCLTPAPGTRQEAIDLIEAMVEQIGAKLYYIDPVEHDAYVAGVSHLPFLLSAALVEVTTRSPAWREMGPLASSGFRDMTRLASGDPVMHRDICMTNRAALTRWIDAMVSYLLDTREQLEGGQGEQVLEMFQHARDLREAWLETKPHMRPGEDEFESMGNAQVERPNWFGQIRRPGQDQKRDRRR